ncbi:MAG: DUF86 domain-containing protein [Candidatus Omnitrophota bacterium]
MKRDSKFYIKDILDSMEKIEKYTKGLSFREFSRDEMLIDAVVRNFEIIGEASKNIPSKLRSLNEEIPWKEMAGMRDKITHDYFGVDLKIVWKTLKKSLPVLKISIKNILK